MIAILPLVLALAGAPPAPARPAIDAPEFAVRTSDGALHVYPAEGASRANGYRIDDATVRARVERAGEDLWRLRLDRTKREIGELYFPWQSKREPLDGDKSDDIFYQTLRLGMTWKATATDEDFVWKGGEISTYPGGSFAPFTIEADGDDARLVAAANWPPRCVVPQFASERMVLRYSQPLRKGARGEWTTLIARFHTDSKHPAVPWQLAAARYRRWLDGHLAPARFPDWMWRADGFLNVQLENYIDSPEAETRRVWSKYRNLYPWILFWGQMSPYAGDCCALDLGIHPRYAGWLERFMREEVVAQGYHGGFYAAPDYGGPGRPKKLLDTRAGVEFLRRWVDRHRRTGANSFYIDTLGGTFYGEPTGITGLFSTPAVPVDSLVEGAVDIYPAAALISGAMTGYGPFCGAPFKQPEDWPSASFPRLGRYLLGDRIMFAGGANSDWIFWGEQRGWKSDADFVKMCGYAEYCAAHGPCEHWIEREAFLLGAKLDVIWPDDNAVLDRILSLRRETNWWDRRPVYLDTEGLDLSAIGKDARVDVRRHRDRAGRDLLTVYNEGATAGLSVKLDGREIRLPAEVYTVVEGPARP